MTKIFMLRWGIMGSTCIFVRKNLQFATIRNGKDEFNRSWSPMHTKYVMERAREQIKVLMQPSLFPCDSVNNDIKTLEWKCAKRYWFWSLSYFKQTARSIRWCPYSDTVQDTTQVNIMIGMIRFGDSYLLWEWGNIRNLEKCSGEITLIGIFFRMNSTKNRYRFTLLIWIELTSVLFHNCMVFIRWERGPGCLKLIHNTTYRPISTKQMLQSNNLPFPRDTNPFQSLSMRVFFSQIVRGL